MYLKQARTYVLMIISIAFYVSLVYFPMKKPTMDQVLTEFANTAGNLHVDSPDYSNQLNIMLNDTLKMRHFIHQGLYNNGSPGNTDEQAYLVANSQFHRIQMQLLLLSFNHDLYTASQGVTPTELTQDDLTNVASLIDSVTNQDISSVQRLKSTCWKLMRDKHAPLGGIYILASDMELSGGSSDLMDGLYFGIDRTILEEKKTLLHLPDKLIEVNANQEVTSSFVNQEVDAATEAMRSAPKLSADHMFNGGAFNAGSMFDAALGSYDAPQIPLPSGPAFIRLQGSSSFRLLTSGPFQLNMPDGKYDLRIIRDGYFPVVTTLTLGAVEPNVFPLTRSDGTVYQAVRSTILDALRTAGLDTVTVGMRTGLDYQKASDSYLLLEQAIANLSVMGPPMAAEQYADEEQPDQRLEDFKQLNDKIYSLVNGYADDQNVVQSLLQDTVPKLMVFEMEPLFVPTGQTPVRLDYTFADVLGVKYDAKNKDHPTAMFVRFAWVDPVDKAGGWDVLFRNVNGRWFVQGVFNRVGEKAALEGAGTKFDYKTNNNLKLIDKYGLDWHKPWKDGLNLNL